ncbi:hypothetical protein [Nonomuraea sp. B19D2]|uniref:hypothetical protein n=1 Tax=Nonomuraea sp. B19D2 TaxID=3159561 RepID=UPI0032DAE48C
MLSEFKITRLSPVCEQTEMGARRRTSAHAPIAPVPMDGRKIAPTRAAWLDAVDYLARAACNQQRHRNLMRLAWQLATRTDVTMMTAPKRGATWDVLAEEVGVSRRTIAYLLAWMRDRQLLITVTTGSTPHTRPGSLWGRKDDGLGNLAAEYALTIPAELLADDVDDLEAREPAEEEAIPWPVETVAKRPTFSHVSEGVEDLCTPAVWGCSLGGSFPDAGARDSSETTDPSPSWSRLATPGSKRDQIAACERLRQDNRLTLGILSAKDLRSLLRPLFVAGFTVADVEHALNRMPDGQRWGDIDPGRLAGTVERKRGMRARIRHRVGLWVDADGTPLTRSASQQAEDAEVAMWRAQERRLAVIWGTPNPEPVDKATPMVGLAERRTPPAEYLSARAALWARLKEGA